jgi:hypothetical protein
MWRSMVEGNAIDDQCDFRRAAPAQRPMPAPTPPAPITKAEEDEYDPNVGPAPSAKPMRNYFEDAFDSDED